jgi:hypothetical protein
MEKILITELDVREIADRIRKQGVSEFRIDLVEVCNVCQYRYSCVDTIPRKYIPERNSYINTKECIFNPYINKWNHEDGYYDLKTVGVVSNEKEFSVSEEVLNRFLNES